MINRQNIQTWARTIILAAATGATATLAGCAGIGTAADLNASDTTATRTVAADPVLTNSQSMKLVLISAGSFTMGSPTDESRREMDEVQHQVQITNDFYLAATEVTRGQFAVFVRETHYKTDAEYSGDPANWRNAGIDQQDNHPVVFVSWHDADAYCDWLSKKEGQRYRLPSEAEWEYSARAGGQNAFGESAIISTTEANFNGNTRYGRSSELGQYRKSTIAVGRFAPNAWGLHDMVGNVWEWCGDWYGRYHSGLQVDPTGPRVGTVRVARGGSWANAPEYCRASYRFGGNPTSTYSTVGFRVAMDVPVTSTIASRTTRQKASKGSSQTASARE
jgi:formylglycine-generating enzyme required for sulfatase activity